LEYKKSLNLKSYHEKPYKTRSHGKEAKSCMKVAKLICIAKYLRSHTKSVVGKKPHKTRSCMKVYSYVNLCYKIQLHRMRSYIKPGVVGKKPYKSRSGIKVVWYTYP